MKNVIIIGIAGGSGSGKTTLARNIAEHFGDRIAALRHDDYYFITHIIHGFCEHFK